MWLVGWSHLAVLLLHHSQGLGAVKELSACLALLGVKDVQDLLAVPLRASKSSPVYILQLCGCMQHATHRIDTPFGRLETPCHSIGLGLSLVFGSCGTCL